MRSIFNFISFPGIADQGGGSQKAPTFSIDYLQVEIENVGRNREAKKMKNFKKMWFYQFQLKISNKFIKFAIF